MLHLKRGHGQFVVQARVVSLSSGRLLKKLENPWPCRLVYEKSSEVSVPCSSMGPVEATTQMKRENILRETTVFEPSVTKSLLFFTVEGRIHDAMHNVHIFRSMLGLLVAYNSFAQGHFLFDHPTINHFDQYQQLPPRH